MLLSPPQGPQFRENLCMPRMPYHTTLITVYFFFSFLEVCVQTKKRCINSFWRLSDLADKKDKIRLASSALISQGFSEKNLDFYKNNHKWKIVHHVIFCFTLLPAKDASKNFSKKKTLKKLLKTFVQKLERREISSKRNVL